MADDKRKRGEQTPGGDQGQDGQRGGRDRKPGGSMESPGSSPTRREDEDESQE